ncbi:MAG: N-acetylmuramoyl-L-alanine amidase [Lachnospiraceae bacterium]|nr:N-acetylmuramoyl-L-alanine amidase [Lachnospiraceae bacterium]
MAAYTIVLDPGHGATNPGAVYNGRQEKDDVLSLAFAVGDILKNYNINVLYTRWDDESNPSVYQRARDANWADADYFISFHRNSSPVPNTYSGVESLVYSSYGPAAVLADNINQQLEQVGFRNLGVNERPNLVVLNSTDMPSVLLEIGFINTDADNALFDERFYDIAQAIADGILMTIYP